MNKKAILLAILAAALYGIGSPFAKLLLVDIPPVLLAALLYLGAGLGMLAVNRIRGLGGQLSNEAKLTRVELPFVIGMVLLDVAAPVFLMIALTLTTAANASLLNNFEIVATALIALIWFKETIGRRMWIAIALITLASSILSIEDASSFSFSIGSLFVLLACACWGLENNLTRMLSLKDPLQIVVIKGFGSGIGSLILAMALKQGSRNILYLALALVLGFFAYGLSIFFYISAQRTLGAARTSAYYAVAPFIGVAISILVFGQKMSVSFVIALLIMISGAYFAAVERHSHVHTHEAITHEHKHQHQDGHHTHLHDESVNGEHSHEHTHEAQEHAHAHTPDLHHKHRH
jgi:drug/metabolite transporter (DMT)-like permease